jgi:predicted GH43/DUF377 family glycosyl hydrolase
MIPKNKLPELKRTGIVLQQDRKRVLIRPFLPSNRASAERRMKRLMVLSDAESHALLNQVFHEFQGRHPQQIQELLLDLYEKLPEWILQVLKPDQIDVSISSERKQLIAAYFSNEYSLEAAALFNPSIVPHPEQGVGELKFVLSLRATGEGHISSVEFRSGIIDDQLNIKVETPNRHVTAPQQIKNASYEKALFERKLQELGQLNDRSRRMLEPCGENFTFEELRRSMNPILEESGFDDPNFDPAARAVLLLARSNYEVKFSSNQNLSERILFPSSPTEVNGIEDARFVLFENEDGSKMYYATYTAYDGKCILPQLLETPDFLHFKFNTLNGPAVHNKGMALFPRKINGLYAMLARQDDENIFIMFSDHLHFWHSTKILLEPSYAWEFIKIGNCGSPIETESGWLVLTHGVGAMRKYSIGAILLDRKDPTRVIGRLREPLISPDEIEREGYVPNVVYTCGALAHKGSLVIPYAMSDLVSSFATVSIESILAALS